MQIWKTLENFHEAHLENSENWKFFFFLSGFSVK
jgi:hypothetical protein